RKRQRSTSLNSATSSTSPKRAVSEDAISYSLENSTSTLTSSTLDLDTLMSDLAESSNATDVPTQGGDAISGEQRLARIEELRKHSMQPGDVWYIISRSWWRRWRRSITGEVDKDEKSVMEEADIGPVENASILEPNDELKPNLVEGVDFEFVPKEAWDLLVQWYGESEHALPRSVIRRGAMNSHDIVEVYPYRFRAFRVTDEPWKTETHGSTEYYIYASQAQSVRDLIRDLAEAVEPALTDEYRVWHVEASGLSGGDWPSGKLMDINDTSTLLDPSDDLILDALIDSGDAFAVEFQKNSKWLVTKSDKAKDDPKPLFSQGNDFFGTGRFKPVTGTKATSTVSTASSSSFLKPAAPIAKPAKIIPPGTLGLGNLGNTCFMNSAIQCLAHTRELADYFLMQVFSQELNPDNPLGMGGAIAESFGALLGRIWAPNATSFPPREFKQVLARFAPQFSGYQQHDSQELVAFLLDGLHEDLNRVLKKPYVEKPDWEGGGDIELVKLAKDSWEGYMKRNDSVIVDLFQSQYRSTLICPECNKVSVTFDPFMYLTLPLPVHKKWRHEINYIPTSPSKPHVKVWVEVNGDASFKEVRLLLGRWMETNPEHLMTMEIFSHKFYKILDDSVFVSEMQPNDTIFCFELPCPSRQSRSWKPSDTDPFLIPVILADVTPPRFTSFPRQSNPNNFGHPMIVAITREDARSVERIEECIVEQLSRWTRYSRELWSWLPTEEAMEEVRISFADSVVETVTEIKENGDVIVQALRLEEGDIVDERGMMLDEEPSTPASSKAQGGQDSIRRTGIKKEVFVMKLQPHIKDYGSGYTYQYNKFEEWGDRRHEAAADQVEQEPVLLQADDQIVLEFESNMREFYFGTEGAMFDSWVGFQHPDIEEARRLAKAQKNSITLDDCLKEFTKEEQLGEDDLWYCPTCKKHQQATKKFDIWGVPDVLVVHLKRFSNSRLLRDKIDTFVDFPVTGLDLTEMAQERKVAQRLREQGVDVAALGICGDLDEPLLYDLFAVDEHLGGLGGGHYRAYAYNHGTDKWHHFDDSFVTEARPQDAVNANAYLLFYRRRTSRPLGGKTHVMIEEARAKTHLETCSSPNTDVPISNVQAQLPTPPNEPAPPALPRRLGEMAHFGTARWATPGTGTASSPSSSPPPLDDADPPSFDDAQLDDVLQTTLDPLVLANHHFDFGSSKASPSSSIEAELDESEEERP
ncbi:hypothetical protein K488DRAFT_12425, partial [Vararia minispora EC-137]